MNIDSLWLRKGNVMQFLRTIQKAQNGTIIIELPAELANEEVEVIVLPMRAISEASTASVPKDKGKSDHEQATYVRARQRFLNLDTSSFSQQQLDAYHQTRKQLLKGRGEDEPRILGLTSGIVQLAADFNAPLPDEHLFYEGEAADTEADA